MGQHYFCRRVPQAWLKRNGSVSVSAALLIGYVSAVSNLIFTMPLEVARVS